MPNENLQVTSASDWKAIRKTGFLLTLPSGKVARIRRTLTLINSMEKGTIPNPIVTLVTELLEGKRSGLDPSVMTNVQIEAMNVMMTSEMPMIFVDPKVMLVPPGENAATWEPEEEGAISIVDLSPEDRSFAYSFAQGGPASLEEFQKLAKAVATQSNVTALQNQSEPAAEDS